MKQMKHISAKIDSRHYAGVAPSFPCTFGELVIVVPAANQDLETHERCAEGESAKSAAYMHEVAQYLYARIGGADFDALKEALNTLRV